MPDRPEGAQCLATSTHRHCPWMGSRCACSTVGRRYRASDGCIGIRMRSEIHYAGTGRCWVPVSDSRMGRSKSLCAHKDTKVATRKAIVVRDVSGVGSVDSCFRRNDAIRISFGSSHGPRTDFLGHEPALHRGDQETTPDIFTSITTSLGWLRRDRRNHHTNAVVPGMAMGLMGRAMSQVRLSGTSCSWEFRAMSQVISFPL
jgi:hypothetical protein